MRITPAVTAEQLISAAYVNAPELAGVDWREDVQGVYEITRPGQRVYEITRADQRSLWVHDRGAEGYRLRECVIDSFGNHRAVDVHHVHRLTELADRIAAFTAITGDQLINQAAERG